VEIAATSASDTLNLIMLDRLLTAERGQVLCHWTPFTVFVCLKCPLQCRALRSEMSWDEEGNYDVIGPRVKGGCGLPIQCEVTLGESTLRILGAAYALPDSM
jgi:hypothetical protein